MENAAVVIYVSGNSQTGYRLRYELKRELDSGVIRSIDVRMRKSFLLDPNRPEALTLAGINQKSQLMSKLFEIHFGLTSRVIIV
jgi:hypothetical protein